MLTPNQKPTGHLPNLTIFDWDDTLFPTTTLIHQNSLQNCLSLLEQSPSFAQQLQRIEEEVFRCLIAALRHGYVCIITNSENGWVQLSASLFFPRIVSLLSKRVKVVSAREVCGDITQTPLLWKKTTFTKVLKKLNLKLNGSTNLPTRSVVSVGDSWNDRESLICACTVLPSVLSKSVKFLESPSLDRIESELKFLSRQLSGIHKINSSIDVMMQCRGSEQCFLDISAALTLFKWSSLAWLYFDYSHHPGGMVYHIAFFRLELNVNILHMNARTPRNLGACL